MKKIDKDFIEVMTLEQIIDKVSSCHPGSFHRVTILDGKPQELGDGSTLYTTETLHVRFHVNYGNTPHIMLRNLINLAITPEEITTCQKIYEKLKHKNLISKRTMATFEKKVDMVAKGIKIPEPSKEKEIKEKTKDTKYPFIIYYENGTVSLMCFNSWQNTIKNKKGHSFEFKERGIDFRYFLKLKSGDVYELLPGTEKEEKMLAKARADARLLASKKGGGEASVYTPSINNIIDIR